MSIIKPVAVAVTIFILLSGFILLSKSQTPKTLIQTPTPTQQEEKVNPPVGGKASFTITTGNITRSFTAEKYHNQSPHVYLEKADPTIVNVTKADITWDDFFKTLPMKLTKDCLTTGDGETLCNEKDGALKFYLNNIETPDLLDKRIRDGDKALINFLDQ